MGTRGKERKVNEVGEEASTEVQGVSRERFEGNVEKESKEGREKEVEGRKTKGKREQQTIFSRLTHIN